MNPTIERNNMFFVYLLAFTAVLLLGMIIGPKHIADAIKRYEMKPPTVDNFQNDSVDTPLEFEGPESLKIV
jgi:hypothetical protein